MAADSIYQAAADVLAVCEELLGQTSAGAPSRVFVCNGDPPFDCPSQLTVHVPTIERATVAPTGAVLDRGDTRYGQVVLATLVVVALRPVPVAVETNDTIVLPDVPSIEAASLAQMTDGWVLYQGLYARHASGSLLGEAWRSFDVGAAGAVVAQGGTGGWTVPIIATVDAVLRG